ncbi:MAG: uncharacterized membrane protein (UPF0127 family) [Gammaproteobacteria bacterium]|jgi:uncharacterized membrane protein (UPF0127 family)
MTRGSLHRVDNKVCIISEACLTTTMFERMRGLLGSPPLQALEALLIKPCSSVHTIGMKYSIDLAYLDKHWTIVKTVHTLNPWRMSTCPSAHMVLELLGGSLEQHQLAKGMQLEWRDA